jgi:16S rRNA (cytosine1407-C5)-methyltransferase
MNKKSGIPEKFTERLVTMFGPQVGAEVAKTFVERPTTFRINRIACPVIYDTYGKKKPDLLIQDLQRAGFQFEKVPWYADAFILKNKSKRELTETEPYKQGKLYIQSLASMVPPILMAPVPGEKVLDLTAAPGSKTSQIAAFMECQGELVANDLNKIRFFKLKHNMELLGIARTHPNWRCVLRMEHGAALAGEYPLYFDKILLDAPCSAEARFVNGEPETYGYWKEQKIKEMAFKQRTLLLSAWGALKPGGTLVYSTCTFAPEENELQIARLLERMPDARLVSIELPGVKKLPILKKWGAKEFSYDLQKCFRLFPTREIEGFFIARIEKTVDSIIA